MELSDLLAAQRSQQVNCFGTDPLSLPLDERADYVRLNVLAATDELHELLAEMTWKPWDRRTKGVVLRPDRAASEIADVLAFVCNLALAYHVSADELVAAIRAKHEEVRERCRV